MGTTNIQTIKDEVQMWCDLWREDLRAQTAHHEVTRRAALYVRLAGLPMEKVYDALKIDADGWTQRLADLETWEQANREAARKSLGTS